MNRPWPESVLWFLGSGYPHAVGYAQMGHGVHLRQTHVGLGGLGVEAMVFQVVAEQGLVAKHYRLG